MGYVSQYLIETQKITETLDAGAIERLAEAIACIRDAGGRLFVLGVGGSAGHASHCAGDFRKQCGIEAYAPTDNVCELTARTNDDGWDTSFAGWLRGSRIRAEDGLLIFSIGGGDRARNVSVNIVNAIDLALSVSAKVCGIVGRPDGYTAQVGDAVVVVPALFKDHAGPHTEGMMAVIWHLLLWHPLLRPAPAGA